jgi:uncharacterized iron-regulated membrane protein
VFRKTIFWAHLSVGVAAGLVVLMMSATGVLLTYERQILAWADRSLVSEPVEGQSPLGIAGLLDAARQQEPDFAPSSVTLSANPRAPVTMSAGRGNSRMLDPYTGEMLAGEASGLHAFFDAVTGWHRWFNVEDENRNVARAITGASNLGFLFLLLSGIYLWLPPVYNRVAFRTRLLFNPKAGGGKARDYNWHHVFGSWSVVPLAVIVASATVFYYGWANELVYKSFGEEPPARGGPPPREAAPVDAMAPAGRRLSLDELTKRAATQVAGWRTLTLTLPGRADEIARYSLDRGTGGQPQHRHDVTLDAATGEVIANERFAGSPARRTRLMLRFLHTGEALGLAGQTIAGLVSLTSVLMVWTGLALAWRRLIRPLLTRRRVLATTTD